MKILSETDIPKKLFEAVMKLSEYKSIGAAEIPILLHKIACIVKRRIIRVQPGLAKDSSIPKELV